MCQRECRSLLCSLTRVFIGVDREQRRKRNKNRLGERERNRQTETKIRGQSVTDRRREKERESWRQTSTQERVCWSQRRAECVGTNRNNTSSWGSDVVNLLSPQCPALHYLWQAEGTLHFPLSGTTAALPPNLCDVSILSRGPKAGV